MKKLSNKGQVGGISNLILGIVGATITLVVGFVVIAELKGASTSTDANTSIDTIVLKLGLIPNFIGIIIIVALASVVLGFFFLRGRR